MVPEPVKRKLTAILSADVVEHRKNKLGICSMSEYGRYVKYPYRGPQREAAGMRSKGLSRAAMFDPYAEAGDCSKLLEFF